MTKKTLRVALTPLLIVLLGVLSYAVALPSQVQADNRLNSNGHFDANGGLAHMKFRDSTGSEWPVGTAVSDWDVANNIDVDWEAGGSTTTCGRMCVRVRSADESDPNLTATCNQNGDIPGYFTNSAPDANNHWDTDGRVVLNRNCINRSAAFRRALVCQELGHALGLDHASVTTSCMFQDPSDAASTPRPHDTETMLDGTIYDHAQ